MNGIKYIEINSTYRDRNLWPLSSEFEIPIAQFGNKYISNTVDPVSLSTPIFAWTSNNLDMNGSSILGTLPGGGSTLIIDNNEPIQNTSDGISFVIESKNQTLQQLKNYYDKLVVVNFNNQPKLSYRRIIGSTYLGATTIGLDTYYKMQVTISQTFQSFNNGDPLYISDPTDFTDVNNPLIFIPNGPPQENAYNSHILYNETINQSRPILSYNNLTNIITLDTTGNSFSTNISGPIVVGIGNWQTTDNFSIRKKAPIIPILGILPTLLITLNTTNTIIEVVDNSSLLSRRRNYYKNQFLRILPNNYYNYNPIPINNESSRIVSYTYDLTLNIATFTVYPPFSKVPTIGAPIEILPYSYDNFNPLIYTGSRVSQQNLVAYEIQLLSLTLPNATLTVGNGGRIAFYPFVYVQLSNISSTGSTLKNILYSNDPNSTNVIFRAPVYDLNNPLNTPFVRINGRGMTQTIKFKPNDSLYFKVSMASGETYKTILPEFFSPAEPNPLAQITALFGIKRISI